MTQKEQWSIEELCETFKGVAEIDKDNIISVDGKTGSGKSTIAVKLCIRGCPWFDIDKDILYSKKEIIEWVTTARPGSWAVADEAVNALFKRDFQKGEQKFLLKILDMCRDRNLTLFLCIPNFWALDKHILEGRIRLRIHVAYTGMAFLWKPTTNPFTPDTWCRKYNEKVCYNWDSYPNARRTKGFVGYVKFGDLGADQRQKYLDIKVKKKAQVKAEEEAEEKRQDILKRRSVDVGKMIMIDFFDSKELLKLGWKKALAEAEGVTERAIYKRIKIFREAGGTEKITQNMQELSSLYNNNSIVTDLE